MIQCVAESLTPAGSRSMVIVSLHRKREGTRLIMGISRVPSIDLCCYYAARQTLTFIHARERRRAKARPPARIANELGSGTDTAPTSTLKFVVSKVVAVSATVDGRIPKVSKIKLVGVA